MYRLSLPGALAAADLSAAQYKVVEYTGTDAVNVLNAVTDKAAGILQNEPTSGQPADVVFWGQVQAMAGAAITRGAKVMANASGKLVTLATGGRVIGVCLEAASADGDIVNFFIDCVNVESNVAP